MHPRSRRKTGPQINRTGPVGLGATQYTDAPALLSKGLLWLLARAGHPLPEGVRPAKPGAEDRLHALLCGRPKTGPLDRHIDQPACRQRGSHRQ
jgi:hypothetical protein